jgi:hypothetical protein
VWRTGINGSKEKNNIHMEGHCGVQDLIKARKCKKYGMMVWRTITN